MPSPHTLPQNPVGDLPADTDLAAEINAEHQAAYGAAQSALDHARRAGELLIAAKARVPHGGWLPWLAEHCPTISEQQAQRYMRIARRWPELDAKSVTVTDLTQREALALLAEPHDDDQIDEDDPLRVAHQIECEHRDIDAELRVIERAIHAPELTIDECTAIIRRCLHLQNQAAASRFRAEQRECGRLINQHPFLLDLLQHPELSPQLFAACDARIAELQAAEVRR